jgi:aromatic ring-opening dioxygenase LigB subunit
MGLVYACIAPHGAEIIPQLAGEKLEGFSETRRGIEAIAAEIGSHKIDTIVIATPHNMRLRRSIGVVVTEFSEGTLKTESGSVQIRSKCDRVLAEGILQSAEKVKLPVVGVNYGTAEGEASCMPMDWGTLIPLWFFGHQKKNMKLVIVTPSREIPLEILVRFGNVIARVAEKSSAIVAFVASADQAHAHKKKGPYGFHADAARFDKLVVDAIKEGDLGKLLSLDKQFVENAMPDSIWQIAILSGILERVPMRGRLVSYEAPTYFGMLCAAYTTEHTSTGFHDLLGFL